MNIPHTVTVISMLLGTWLYAGCPPYYDSIPQRSPDFRYHKGDWELKVWYIHKGTRSEGKFGFLTHKGQEACPRRDGDLIDTPLGRLHFNGHGPVWSFRGWSFANGSKNPPPSWLLDRKNLAVTPADNRSKSTLPKENAQKLWKDFQKDDSNQS
jgi:hypothetical protein